MSDADQRQRSPAVVVAVAFILPLALSAYVLSTGPLWWLMDHGYINRHTIECLRWLYAPLDYLRDHSTTFRDVLDWYISLWR